MKICFDNNLYNNNGLFQKTNFKGKGIDLITDFQQDRNLRLLYYNDIADDLAEGTRLYFQEHKDIDDSVNAFHQYGGLTVLFDLPNDEVLKISLENPLEYRPHNPEFDIPFLSPVEQYGKTYIVKQPMADTENITNEEWKDTVKRIILKGGCELSKDGYKYEQYGRYEGKVYLLDTRCAMPLPNLWTIIVDKIYSKHNKCYVYVNKEQSEMEKEDAYKKIGYFSYHTDETPRKSLDFKGGLLKIFTMVKNNIKYKKNHYCIPYEVSRAQMLQLKKYIQM